MSSIVIGPLGVAVRRIDMDASAIAAMASNNALAQVQQEASVEVLRKALDLQGQSAMQLLQAIPRPPAVGSTAGGVVDTWA
jgi:hypothetical protein